MCIKTTEMTRVAICSTFLPEGPATYYHPIRLNTRLGFFYVPAPGISTDLPVPGGVGLLKLWGRRNAH